MWLDVPTSGLWTAATFSRMTRCVVLWESMACDASGAACDVDGGLSSLAFWSCRLLRGADFSYSNRRDFTSGFGWLLQINTLRWNNGQHRIVIEQIQFKWHFRKKCLFTIPPTNQKQFIGCRTILEKVNAYSQLTLVTISSYHLQPRTNPET